MYVGSHASYYFLISDSERKGGRVDVTVDDRIDHGSREAWELELSPDE